MNEDTEPKSKPEPIIIGAGILGNASVTTVRELIAGLDRMEPYDTVTIENPELGVNYTINQPAYKLTPRPNFDPVIMPITGQQARRERRAKERFLNKRRTK